MKRMTALALLALPFALLACRTNDGEPKVATTASASPTQTAQAEPAPSVAAEPAPTQTAAPAPVVAAEEDITKAARITVPELQQKLAGGNAIIVDVRPADAYADSHILGAINIPLSDLATRMGELPKDKFIATYCT
jgi:hypothetical protein